MRPQLARGLFAALTTCALMAAGPAFAGGSGMPWEGPLRRSLVNRVEPVRRKS